MSRTKLNLLASMLVLVGAWSLAPQPAWARSSDRACCESGDDQCCGDACRKTADGCEACTGVVCLGFF